MKAIILAGGGGSRLWPLSTSLRPKQFQKLISEKYLIEETLDRLDFLNPEDIFISITEDQINLLRETLPRFPTQNVIIEPALRDTASCIGLAAAAMEKKFPQSVMGIFYADHLIQDKEEFQSKIKLAEQIAQKENTLNIVEVSAKSPNTNYGYVELGEETSEKGVYKLKQFKEKPDALTAKQFIESGNFLWNTGYYIWKSSKLLEKFKEFKPETYEKLMKITDSLDTEHAEETLREIYPTLEKISIDYAIMENVNPEEVRIIKADFGWSDIGNWESIWEELKKDHNRNIKRGDIKTWGTKDSLIYADSGKPVRVIGIDNVVIVDTPEGLIVSKKEMAKKIKELL